MAASAEGAGGAGAPLRPGPSPPLQPSQGVSSRNSVGVTCSDVPGVLHLEHLYVSCHCADCEARVQAGHDRPIFGLR